MKFKLFGTEIYVSFLFAAVITLMLATDRTGYILPTLFASMVHEAGHLFAMWVKDCAPKKIKLIPASVQITRPVGSNYKTDIVVALCGPIVNIVLFFTLFFNYLAFKNQTTLYFALLNLIIGLFNALPVSGLDGGTVLFSLIAQKKGVNKATVTLRTISLAFSLIILIIAIILTVKGNVNISLFIIAIYLAVMSIIKL